MKIRWTRPYGRHDDVTVDGRDEVGKMVATLRYRRHGISVAIVDDWVPGFTHVVRARIVPATYSGSAFDGAKAFVAAWLFRRASHDALCAGKLASAAP